MCIRDRLKGAQIAGLSVAATAPAVRPWNALEKASTFVRPVWNEASFREMCIRDSYSIIPGGENHEKFKGWLDKVADFMLSLKSPEGEPIPLRCV